MISSGGSRAFLTLALLAAPFAGGCGAGEDLIAPESGGVEVSTAPSGAGSDADGVVVVVDAATRHSLLPDTTLRLSHLSIGSHTLAVEGLGSGCVLSGPNPRDVTVFPDSVVRVVLEISCAATGLGGTLLATVLTEGVDPDDGYSVVVDALPSQAVAATDSVAFTALSADSHLVRLAGVIDRCTVAGANPWTFQVGAPDTARITWEITCWPPARGRIAFIRVQSSGRSVFMINADGTRLAQLTGPEENADTDPVWSPDGMRIAYINDSSDFDSRTRLRVLDVASHTVLELPIGSLSPFDPQWSPDGMQLSFGVLDDNFEFHVYVVDADGISPPRPLVELGMELSAVWSPDGSRLAFVGTPDSGDVERVYVTDLNGTSPRAVSPVGLLLGLYGGDPDWSPDGTRVVFSAAHPLGEDFGYDLYVVGADGSGPTNITTSPPFSSNVRPHWSPDGKVIAYTCSDVNRKGTIGDICTIPWSGGPRTNLTNHLESYSELEWSPDGDRLVFGRPSDNESSSDDLFVMNADGSGLVRLTQSDAQEDSPSWTR